MAKAEKNKPETSVEPGDLGKTEKSKPGKKSFIVASSFRDRDNFEKQYLPGDDVGHLQPDRLEHLVKNGLVKDDQ